MQQQQIIEFLKTLQTWEVEINNLKEKIKLKEALTRVNENIYFLSWVKKWIKSRASDKDIESKKYFVIDIDVENQYKALYWVDNDISIVSIAKDLISVLKDNKTVFSNWRYIVFSWRWLHIYYTFPEQTFNIKEYSLWVKELYRQWDDYLDYPVLNADTACCNIARIMRLPWTINQKNGQMCEIIGEQDKDFELDIAEIWKEQLRLKTIADEKRAREIEKKLKNYDKWWNEAYENINNIPAYEIAQMLIPEFAYDWTRNFKNGKWWYTGYFYNSTTNTICNGWSRYFNDWDSWSCYNNFILVKNYKWWTSLQVFNFFKELLKW